MKKAGLIILLLSILLNDNAQEFNDTVRVVINLKQVDSSGLKITVYPPSDLSGNVLYQFPKSIPGIYEYLNSPQSWIKVMQNGSEIFCNDNSFQINSRPGNPALICRTRSTVNKFQGISALDTYFVKDSVYILNWHYLLGFFQNGTDRPYRLEVIRNAEFFGAGTLFKTIKNDSTDVYIAGNYKELIHHPIMYSVPDTTSFEIGETHFTISCAGNDSLFNSEKIRNLIFNPLNEIYGQSVFKQNQYTFLYYSEYSLSPPYLTGLEHPNSTLICYHSALLDNKILISSSIHEYIHALFAPLRIRSEVIDSFNFTTPHCDEFLWFYEGVTEYLAIKTMVNSGYFTTQDFFNELNESYEFYKNINLSKISFNIYGKKEQDLFDNFYTKGSLFAMQLDVEIIRRSNGKTDLSAVMNKLQNQYNPEIPFDSKTFFTDFSKTAGVNIERYLIENTRKKKKVNFPEIAEQTGYTKEYNDTLIWSFKTRKQYLVINQKNDRLEIVLFGSTINKTCNSRKVTIYEINGKPVNWYNYDSLLMPEDGQELSLKAISKDEIIEVKAIPEQILKEKKHLNWSKNSNIESAMANYYWNK